MSKSKHSPYLQAISKDSSLPLEQAAVTLWLKDLDNPFRWTIRPLLQFLFAILLHIVWLLKRLPLPQFSAHSFLQKTICWFCTHFVSPEANLLILRHFATESNILNFMAENSNQQARLELYPKSINDMLKDSFVKHDQELFDCFIHLENNCQPLMPEQLKWQEWRTINMDQFDVTKRKTQVFDFETSHALFMCLFCLLLTKEEYRDAINGFNLDQSIAIRIGNIIGEPEIVEYAYNKYPQYLVGPWNLGQRFLMHGFFTEYLYARLETIRTET
ncbi:DUF6999 family protein [Psychrosphaera aestuarii]|uniref:DUF6999 family protein n=1 Tax=Psychrosphaera aestuarii TaxID=1266052 RepID=UPI001B34303D|nr:hypothetical protein [Psychrosphaera aestuarii]